MRIKNQNNTMTFRLSDSLKNELEQISIKTKKTTSDVIRMLIENNIDKIEKQKEIN